MPGKDANGNTWWDTDGYGYCDAQAVGAQGIGTGSFCPEIDLIEANSYGFKATPHRCDAPDSNGHYSACDGYGVDIDDALEFGSGAKDFGPGSDYNINTLKEFNYEVYFAEDNGNFVRMDISVWQWNDEHQSYNVTSISKDISDYVDGYDLGQVLRDGLAIAVSSWSAPNTEWITHGRCSGACDNPPPLFIKNIKIWTGN